MLIQSHKGLENHAGWALAHNCFMCPCEIISTTILTEGLNFRVVSDMSVTLCSRYSGVLSCHEALAVDLQHVHSSALPHADWDYWEALRCPVWLPAVLFRATAQPSVLFPFTFQNPYSSCSWFLTISSVKCVSWWASPQTLSLVILEFFP